MSIGRAGWWLAAQGQDDRGLALLGLAFHHPAWDADIERDAELAFAHLELDPRDPAVAAKLEAGRALDLETVAAELLVELGEAEG
jgi:hypothetical protein